MMTYDDIASEHSAHLSYIEILTDERRAELNVKSRYLPGENAILTVRPKTVGNLWLFLHECGHSRLHTQLFLDLMAGRVNERNINYHTLEIEAEFYVYKAMRKAKIDVPTEVLHASVSHVLDVTIGDICAGFKMSQLVLAYFKLTKTEQSLGWIKYAMQAPRTSQLLATWYNGVDHPILKEMPQTGVVSGEEHSKLLNACQNFERFQEVLFA